MFCFGCTHGNDGTVVPTLLVPTPLQREHESRDGTERHDASDPVDPERLLEQVSGRAFRQVGSEGRCRLEQEQDAAERDGTDRDVDQKDPSPRDVVTISRAGSALFPLERGRSSLHESATEEGTCFFVSVVSLVSSRLVSSRCKLTDDGRDSKHGAERAKQFRSSLEQSDLCEDREHRDLTTKRGGISIARTKRKRKRKAYKHASRCDS